MSGRILYITDKFGVSDGYKPAFERMLNKAGIRREWVILANIYNLVQSPLKKYGNENTWKFDDEKLDRISAAFRSRLTALRPTLVVVSDPAVLGVLANGDRRLATLEKMRGGVYEFEGYRCIVTYPVTAIHQRVDTRLLVNDDTGEEDKQEPYQVKDGAQILQWDWQKIGRFYHGKQRKLPEFKYSVCRSLDDLYAARKYLLECVILSTDVETGLYPPTITCVGYTGMLRNGAMHTFVIPFHDPSAQSQCFWPTEDEHMIAWAIVREINESPVIKTMQNGAYDCSYFIRDQVPTRNYLLDSQYMWWSLYMELPKRLDFITSVLCDNYQYWKDDIKGEENESIDSNIESYWRYNALDCYSTLCDTLYLTKLMSGNKAMQFNFNDAMLRTYSGLGMSMRGVKVDWERRDYHRKNLEREMDEKNRQVQWMLDDPEFNVSSSQQKQSLLYDLFGLRERTAKGRFVDPNKPKRGLNAPSGGKIPLKLAKSEHPLFRYIIETIEDALEPRVQLSNIFGYTDSSKPYGVRGGLFMPTGRFRTALNSCGTETTRFSSKKSNFWDGGNAQNIRGDYKDWLIADENHVILDVDYSQSDDVFIAFESQDPDKIKVIEDGLDAHAYNGELFFNIPYDKIVEGKRNKEEWCVHPIKGVRQNSKRAGHGANFQMAGLTLYVTMGREAVVACAEVLGFADAGLWDQDRLVNLCAQLMAKYRRRYKRLNKNEWYKEIYNQLKTTGAITNAFGITRNFIGNPDDNATQREATAFYGQSGTAGNMNRVMYEIDHGWIPPVFRDAPNPEAKVRPLKMDWESHGFSFHLQVHDNFMSQLNLGHSKWREAAHNLLQVMNRPVIIHGRTVRVLAEAELGIRWGKKMLPWDGRDPRDIEGIVAKLKSMERIHTHG